MPDSNRLYIPIIYVRGYAGKPEEQNETTADPFCGFNVGSTVYRATREKDKPARKLTFESTVLRLAAEFGYSDCFINGCDIVDDNWEGTIPEKSIIVHRYYEHSSSLLGFGEKPDISHFAAELSDLILRVRDLVCAHPKTNTSPDKFKCYLVAHSMGGLVCRAFLQNPKLGQEQARQCVDKVFTYATPHNGIEMCGINVPQFLSLHDAHTFNRDEMARYLNLESSFKKTGRVDWLPEACFPSKRFFCMIGTNRTDYEVAKGLSRTFSGHGSDGLVRIENASVWGVDSKGEVSAPAATAFAYRSHSGFFGIVNAEESYQNLIRFLFGNVRVDIWADIEKVELPANMEGESVHALYQFEALAAPKGRRWYLTRRVAEEDSVACKTHEQLTSSDKASRSVYLSTVFLAKFARIETNSESLGYALTFGARVPDYEVERRFRRDSHFEGRYLFRDTLIIELTPPTGIGEPWKAKLEWQSKTAKPVLQLLKPDDLKNGSTQLLVPFYAEGQPGIGGNLRFEISPWNQPAPSGKAGETKEMLVPERRTTLPSDVSDGEISLSWDNRPERKPWSKQLLALVSEYKMKLDLGNPDDFISGYSMLSPMLQKKFWAELIIAIAKFESGWRPNTVFHEPPPLNLDSIGLLQLSYEDAQHYSLKPLNPKNRQLEDPLVNLQWGLEIFSTLVAKDHTVACSSNGRHRGAARYWSVIRAGHKIDQIIALTRAALGMQALARLQRTGIVPGTLESSTPVAN